MNIFQKILRFFWEDHAWLQTATGKKIFLRNPDLSDIDIEDIARPLSNLCRFNGHTTFFYSVAEHSVEVSDHCPPEFALEGLLHDASEAFLGDMIKPLKNIIWFWYYRRLERRWMTALSKRFDFQYPLPKEVEVEDQRALVTEKRDVLISEYDRREERSISPWKSTIQGLGPDQAFDYFMTRYVEIRGLEEPI